ncbi:MAG TPA: glycosyltransferase family 1 protein [Candidatus Omnitrophota bacterium]|nr:glycosyltransferase family 1 protein [Candidatus Omnitrophota bacterium]
MKIAIDIRSTLKKTRTGVGQYTYNLVKNLVSLDREDDFLLYSKIKLFSRDKSLPDIKASNIRHKIERFSAGLDRTLGKVDIFHSPSQDMLNIKGAKIVVTVHDLIFRMFDYGHSKDAIASSERQILDTIAKADKIICYSKSTISDLQRLYNVPDKKIELVYVGVDRDNFYPMAEQEIQKARNIVGDFGVKEDFILFVGTIEPRKNIGNLILAFNALKEKNNIPHKLVIIGMKGWMYEKVFKLYDESKHKKDIMFLDYQPNNILNNFYNLADVFVYPSFYEGFGFPILEAFSCGRAVITSNVSSCKEIGEEAALLIEPNSIDEISSAILRILSDNKLKEDLQRKGLEKSRPFSWQETARKTLQVYREVAGK